MKFSRKQKSSILVQVQDSGLSAMECRQSRQGLVCLAESFVTLDPGIIEQGRMQKPSRFQAALEALLSSPKHGQFQSSVAQLILPEQLFTYHIAHVGSGQNLSSKKKMQDRLLRSLFSQPEQWLIDSSLDTTHDTYRFGFRGLLAEDVNSYREAFNAVRLPISQYHSSSQAARHFYYQNGVPAEMILWVWIGKHQSEVALFDMYGTYQGVTLGYGEDRLLKMVKRELGLSDDAAQIMIHEIGGRQVNHRMARAFQNELGRWLAELLRESRSLSQYAQSVCKETPALLLCGAGSQIPHVTELFSSVLDLPFRSQRSWIKQSQSRPIKEYYHLAPLVGAHYAGSSQL